MRESFSLVQNILFIDYTDVFPSKEYHQFSLGSVKKSRTKLTIFTKSYFFYHRTRFRGSKYLVWLVITQWMGSPFVETQLPIRVKTEKKLTGAKIGAIFCKITSRITTKKLKIGQRALFEKFAFLFFPIIKSGKGQNVAHLGHFNGPWAPMHYFDLPLPPLPTRSIFFGPKWFIQVSHI